MSRQSATTLLQHVDDNMRSVEILAADFTWAVFYKDKPFQMRHNTNIEFTYPGPKYPRVNYQNLAHALRLRDKLNELFDVADFTVVRLDAGYTIV